MPIELGQVVRALAGRDAHGLFAVVGIEPGVLLLADGRRRMLARPKRKNVKHIRKTGTILSPDRMETDRQLRRALGACRADEEGFELG